MSFTEKQVNIEFDGFDIEHMALRVDAELDTASFSAFKNAAAVTVEATGFVRTTKTRVGHALDHSCQRALADFNGDARRRMRSVGRFVRATLNSVARRASGGIDSAKVVLTAADGTVLASICMHKPEARQARRRTLHDRADTRDVPAVG